MHITILAIGSRGDVQPYVALGLGLQKAGHEVRLVAADFFKTFIESRGLDFFFPLTPLVSSKPVGRRIPP